MSAPTTIGAITQARPSRPRYGPMVPTLVVGFRPGGRIVIPVGGEGEVQYLKLLTKRADGSVDEKRVLPVRFVPLVPGK